MREQVGCFVIDEGYFQRIADAMAGFIRMGVLFIAGAWR